MLAGPFGLVAHCGLTMAWGCLTCNTDSLYIRPLITAAIIPPFCWQRYWPAPRCVQNRCKTFTHWEFLLHLCVFSQRRRVCTLPSVCMIELGCSWMSKGVLVSLGYYSHTLWHISHIILLYLQPTIHILWAYMKSYIYLSKSCEMDHVINCMAGTRHS